MHSHAPAKGIKRFNTTHCLPLVNSPKVSFECTVHRYLANDKQPYTNYLHGAVPVSWCQQRSRVGAEGCRLTGVNSLCLPPSCPSNWCNLNHNCDVLNGHWSEWNDECSVTCGGGVHTRACSNPTPTNGGKACGGAATKPCNTQRCPGMIRHVDACACACLCVCARARK